MGKSSHFNAGILLLIFGLILCDNVFAWDDEVTHKDLSDYAAKSSVLGTSGNYLGKLDFNLGLETVLKWGNDELTVMKWIRQGAELEDEGSLLAMLTNNARFNNHFHNPLKQWDSAGLNDYVIMPDPGNPSLPPFPRLVFGESSAMWAQDGGRQETFPEGNWSWQKSRLTYYYALTTQTPEGRQAFFAATFRGLGHQMHLVQDAAVPTHVRNDAHPLDVVKGGFETWAKAKADKIILFASRPVLPNVNLKLSGNGTVPISRLIDTDQYTEGVLPSASQTWGLAEHTNANFVSDDTIFTDGFDPNDTHYFPYPRYDNRCYTLLEEMDGFMFKKTTYLSKTCDGEQVAHFALAGPFFKYLDFNWPLQRAALKLDAKTYYDYAEKLVPRAVGYSAALLNYFFRGDMDMVTDASGFVIVNNSDEDMTGTFELWVDDSNGSRTKYWSGDLSLGKKGSGSDRSGTIKLSLPCSSAKPAGYMLVFSGRMGQEQGAVAGRLGNITLPREQCGGDTCPVEISKWRANNLFDRVLSEYCGLIQLPDSIDLAQWKNEWYCFEENRTDGKYYHVSYNYVAPIAYYCLGETRSPEGIRPIDEMWIEGYFTHGADFGNGAAATSCEAIKAIFDHPFTAEQEYVVELTPRDGCETVSEKTDMISMEQIDNVHYFTVGYRKFNTRVLNPGLYLPPDTRWSWTIEGYSSFAGSGEGFCDNSSGWPVYYYEQRYGEVLEESEEKYKCEDGLISRVN